MNTSRRKFFLQATMATIAVSSVPSVVSAVIPSGKKKNQISLRPKEVVLFQGDSITDAGREKTRELPNNGGSFGGGYAFIIASEMLDRYSTLELSIYNRGISGNKVYQLADRWQKDCLDLKPGLLSILIGINDYWHMRNGNYNGTVEIYENDYRKLLSKTREAIPGIQFVICQPFALPGTSAVDESWVEPVKAYQNVAYKICQEFGAVWVPFQEIFDKAIQYAPAKYWAADGVHPTMAGSHLMAAAWLKAVLGH